jgi:multicomponent Na+:H+ antiporter subunit D
VSGSLPLAIALLLPLVGAVLILAARHSPRLRDSFAIGTPALLSLTVLSLFPEVAAGGRPGLLTIQALPGLTIAFMAEPFGLLFAAVASFLWLVTAVFCLGYIPAKHVENPARFHSLFALSLAATMGVAFSANMLTLFAFYEVLTFATLPLVAYNGGEEGRRAARTYLALLFGASTSFLLVAMVWTWLIAGSLDFVTGGLLFERASPAIMGLLLILYVLGTAKAALMPLHRWLPAAMVAPTPVSALLHAVAVVKAGVFTLLKVALFIFGPEALADLASASWLRYLAAATLLIAGMVALTKDNLKARLAYSTISQLAYITLGALLATPSGALGAGLHMTTHAFAKITLFFCAGTIAAMTGRTEISQLNGIGRRMPLTMLAFTLAALGIVGLPPAGGLWSKVELVLGAFDAGEPWLAGAMLAGSLLTLAYLLPIALKAFFETPDESPAKIREAPPPCLAAIGVTTLVTVLLFFLIQPLYDFLDSGLPRLGMP